MIMPRDDTTPFRRVRALPPPDDENPRMQELLAQLPADTRSAILVSPGEELQVLRQAIEAARNLTPQLFRRGGRLVRVEQGERKASADRTTTVPIIREVEEEWLQPRLQQAMFFQRSKRKSEKDDPELPFPAYRDCVLIDAPHGLAKRILKSSDDWPYPTLVGVISTPTMRPDGTLLIEEGYDEGTGLYLNLTSAPEMPRVKDRPTKNDALAALERLDAALLCGFPIVDEASKSVARSGLMTPVLRAAFPHAPLHAISAPAAGTGKSYFLDVVSYIAVGNPMPTTDYADKREGEFDKTLGALLMDGVALVNIDNVAAALGGSLLCQVVSQDVVKPRILGMSKAPDLSTTFQTYFANGNNLAIEGDLARRVVRMEMNANMERPFERTFDADPVENAKRNRGKHLADILTIGRAYAVAGYQDAAKPFSGFDGWSRVVRSALIWLGCTDPCKTTTTAVQDDPLALQRAALFTAIQGVFGDEEFQVKDLTEGLGGFDASRKPLDDALLAVAGTKGDAINRKALGWWFRNNKNVVVGTKQLVETGSAGGSLRWQLRDVAAKSADEAAGGSRVSGVFSFPSRARKEK